ncbi:MAG: ribonuclease R [Anaerovoracaceae bacterium]|nr:ribonuclease R [Bacillota bacterium]MDY5906817.1 ribonuclease R [Anaerovoracaceae bacterium]
MGKKYKNENNMITPERHEEIKKQIMDLLEHGIAKDQSETGDTEAYADEHGSHKSRRSRKALNESEIAEALGISGAETGEMVTCLDELEAQGIIVQNRRGRYRQPEPDSIKAGEVQITRRGFGFLLPDDGSEDIFLPREDLNGAVNGDRVIVKIDTGRHLSRAGKRYGYVMKITERGVTEVIGTVMSRKNFAFVVSDNKRIEDVYIAGNDTLGARNGDKVRAVITKYPTDEVGMRGRIVEIYGPAGDAKAELKAVLHQYDIPESFDEEVLKEADRVSGTAPGASGVSQTAGTAAYDAPGASSGSGIYSGREDIRDKLIITIDGPDAKDLDDAVNVEKHDDGTFTLGVHIADVSNYVKEDSLLDKEALKRGCSVYLLDTVVPMLPEQLSNGVCSLNRGEDRLTLSMEAHIGAGGEILSYRIFESVIRSSARMVYGDVSDIIERHDEALMKKYEALCPMIFAMDELAGILRDKRMKGGSLDFDIDESYIELDENGVPVDIRPAERRVANRIIEEFMLTANQIVAEHHYWMDVPFAYRVHERPDQDRMESFKAFAGTLGYSLRGSCDNIHPAALRDILIQAEGSDTEGIINRIMLRSMKKADYQPVCEGHFGLGFKYYCHFTSPIRRYPDLFIHRIIKEIIHGEPGSLTVSEKRREELAAKAERACDVSSAQERNAVDAERTIEKKKKAQYMSARIGEQYDGIISGVLNSGFFVELPDTVEGYVSAESLTDDYYSLDADNYRMIGEHTHNVYRVGARVRVQVARVDIITDEIDFIVV